MSRWPEQPVLWWSWMDHKDRAENKKNKGQIINHSFDEYINLFMDGYGRDACSPYPLILNHWIF